MNRVIFETYVETQLAPALKPGYVVIFDNLSSRKSERTEKAIRAQGAWLLFLPPHNEMAFAKLKAHLRARAIRTIDELWKAIGNICAIFTPQECAQCRWIWTQMNARGSRAATNCQYVVIAAGPQQHPVAQWR